MRSNSKKEDVIHLRTEMWLKEKFSEYCKKHNTSISKRLRRHMVNDTLSKK